VIAGGRHIVADGCHLLADDLPGQLAAAIAELT
jgi:hypothetical protein